MRMMKFLIPAISLLLLLQSASALRCYRCWYEEGSSNSIDGCESNPQEQYLIYAPPYPVWSRHPSVLGSYAANFTGVFTVGDDYRQYNPNFVLPWNTYCMKVTGKSYGRDVVIRDSAWSKSPDGNGLCDNRLPGNIQIPGLTDVETCYCNDEDACNGASCITMSFLAIAVGMIASYIIKIS